MISRACSTQAADFYPRPPRGGRPDDAPPPRRAGSFLSTPSARRATIPGRFRSRRIQISIHALREEGDRDVRGVADLQQISIHALREEGDWWARINGFAIREDFYPRPPRGGRPPACISSHSGQQISIHALREEGDAVTPVKDIVEALISIHALREEGDIDERQLAGNKQISIHALREEGDNVRLRSANRGNAFLSTPSARRATSWAKPDYIPTQISIHALREEGDAFRPTC